MEAMLLWLPLGLFDPAAGEELVCAVKMGEKLRLLHSCVLYTRKKPDSSQAQVWSHKWHFTASMDIT